jgi:para-nitrobenzyl esterase
MKQLTPICAFPFLLGIAFAAGPSSDLQVKTDKGVVEGTMSGSGIRIFRGIPFAAPPVGELRWKAPQPAASWAGVRSGSQFGPACMQRPIYGNMGFRGPANSEDCLYLNVWSPSGAPANLPVLVYFFGGGLQAGDGSEPRYDGESMALHGMVAVTISYRVSVFGFMAHPELTAEAPYHASGNYGFLDQNAALKWVQVNIAAFGGDPKRVTIAGQSAGSRSVSVQIISPLSKGLIAGGIMESGILVGSEAPPLEKGEQSGKKFMAMAGASSLRDLRAMPAQKLLDLTADKASPNFNAITDGYVIPNTDLVAYLEAGKQNKVPILQGFNSEEEPYRTVLGDNPATPQGFAAVVRKTFPNDGDRVLAAYPTPKTDEEAMDAAMLFGAERGQGYRNWLMGEGQAKGSGKAVYRYFYLRPRKRFVGAANEAPGQAGGVVTLAANTPRPQNRGAAHSAEIEYVMGNLPTNSRFAWEPGDYLLSQNMQNYFVNFIKTGDPNGGDLAKWPAYSAKDGYQIMQFDVRSKAVPEAGRPRYVLFDQAYRTKEK